MGTMAIAPNKAVDVRFGRKMTAAEFTAMRPMLNEIEPLKALGEYDIKPEFCATTRMPQNPIWNWTRAVDAVVDRVRMALNIRSHWKNQTQWPDLDLAKPYAVNIQQVTLPAGSASANTSDTWQLSNPCSSSSCPTLKSGKPATGRAIKGNTMINWIINERPALPVPSPVREAANPL